MIPLRAAMPSTVTNPTSEPSDRTPPPSTAPKTPPIRANGNVRKTRAVSRTVRKSAWITSRTPSSDSAARASKRRRDSSRAAYSPRNSGWYSRSKSSLLDLGLDLAGDAAQVAPLDVAGHVDPPRGPLALDLVRRRHDRDVGHVAERDVRAQRRLDRQAARAAMTSLRTLSTPQTKTSKIFWSL